MIAYHQFLVLSLFSWDVLSPKPKLFKFFTGLSVQEFDDMYVNKITKRYAKHKMKRLKKIGSNLWVQEDHLNLT
jgi:hypothetical protein